MGLLIFGVVLIGISFVCIVTMYNEKSISKEEIWAKIFFTIALLWFVWWGIMMIMHNNYTFNKHIQTYLDGNYTKEIIYDNNGNEVDVKYRCF